MSNFQSEAISWPQKSIPQVDRPGSRFIYNGGSMLPTFRPGQFLWVRTSVDHIVEGDVIVFREQISSQNIVHRVLAISKSGFVTRGDNTIRIDSNPVQIDQVIGKVEQTEIQGRLKPVIGGRLGLWIAKTRWTYLRLAIWLRKIFRKPYSMLRASRIVQQIWQPTIVVMRLQTENGYLIKYIYRRDTVATWKGAHQEFKCRKPFDLVIPSPLDEKNSLS